ncbi:MAG TPA: diphthamide synthesis protein [Candidatus Nanoarchaeia archaeon]|nr:diphthamide synthesis protein [Candidatus Nanoarchaeia archaeon]
MKTLYIEAKSNLKVNKSKILELSKQLPKNLIIAYSIQFKKIAEEIKTILKSHNIVKFIQVLGCSNPNIPENANAILLVGSGKFHAISLAYKTKLPVFILNRDSLDKISKTDVEIIEKKQKAAYLKFLNSNKIGIIISTKSGQNKIKTALEFAKKCNKKSYLFLSNNINRQEFENFGLSSWVNTACPRLDMDSSVINIDKLLQN